jgi:alpha-beta hydrolase superfamily lysophospholipase
MTDFSPATKALMERFVARDHQYVSEAGRTKLLLHDEVRPTAVVLFHGLSASPTQFERFARELYEHGHNVIVPRLPRHGHTDRMSAALERMNADELRQFATDSIELAHGVGTRVVVAGFSLGGLLAIWSAQHLKVDRAVSIAPFLGVSWIPHSWMAALSRVLLALPNRFAWWDPLLREKQVPAHGYPRYATHALAEALKLSREVFDYADRPINANMLVFVTNSSEAAVNNRTIGKLEKRLSRFAQSKLRLVRLGNLPISHDIIEPLRHPEVADRVFPSLMKLIEGE